MACKSKLWGACTCLFLFLVTPPVAVWSQCRWDGGGGDGLWSTSLNWTGDSLPGASADVIIDNGFVSGSFTVMLPDSSAPVEVQSLVIAPTAGSVIEVVLPSSNTIAPGFIATGPGYGLRVLSGGVFRNASGIASGQSLRISDSIYLGNGGRYVHQTRASHAASLAAILSCMPGTETGMFEFDVPGSTGYTISASGRIFGTLILSAAAAGGTKTYSSGGGNDFRVRGDFRTGEGVHFSLNLDADMIVDGNFVQAGGSFNLSSGGDSTVLRLKKNVVISGQITETANGFPVIELNGSAVQQVNVGGTINNDVSLRINNPAGVALQTPVALPYQLQLLQGCITTSASELLTLLSGCSVIADSAAGNAFVDGPLRKEGLSSTASFLFPVGKNGSMRWLALKEVTGNFTVEYFRSDPHAMGATYGAGIDHISRLEYWKVTTADTSASKATVEISFSDANSGGVTDLNMLRVAQWKQGAWFDLGNTSVTGAAGGQGSVTGNPVTNWTTTGYFTLASAGASNPLPVAWTHISVRQVRDGREIRWRYTGDAVQYFDVLCNGGKGDYETIARVHARPHQRTYSWIDKKVVSGTQYYRLRAVEPDGSETVSKVVHAAVAMPPLQLLSARSTGNEWIAVTVQVAQPLVVQYVVSDMYGRTVMRVLRPLHPGTHSMLLPAGKLASGVYYVRGVAGNRASNVLAFRK